MNIQQLKNGEELLKLINTTQKAIDELKEMKNERREKRDQATLDDGLYNLTISKYSDGSGSKGDMSRYFGNWELLNVIIGKLEEQLTKFQEDFESL